LMSTKERKGGSERRVWAIYRRGLRTKRPGINSNWRREFTERETVSGVISAREGRRLTGGTHCQRGEERKRYRFGMRGKQAVDLFFFWAEWVPRGPFHIFIFFSSFLFLFFVFLLYLLPKMLQINSNHFQKFSKNQHNV
jgi:hypothetical protein